MELQFCEFEMTIFHGTLKLYDCVDGRPFPLPITRLTHFAHQFFSPYSSLRSVAQGQDYAANQWKPGNNGIVLLPKSV